MQIQPPAELNMFIKHYLFLETHQTRKTQYTLFANGNTGLVFSLNNTQKLINSHQITPNAFVFGQVSTHLKLVFAASTKILVVVFQPYGLHLLTKIPGHEMKGEVIEAAYIFGDQVRVLEEKLFGSSANKELLNLVNQFFKDYFLIKHIEMRHCIPQIIHKIIKFQGNLSIQDIINEFAIHERKLQRLFLAYVGLSPKKTIQIAKLHAYIGHLMNRTANENLTSLGYKTGYYDQSHLIKDFKSITGMTPGQYTLSPALAVNLVQTF